MAHVSSLSCGHMDVVGINKCIAEHVGFDSEAHNIVPAEFHGDKSENMGLG